MDNQHLLSALGLLVEDSGGWCQKGDWVTLVGHMPTPNITKLRRRDRISLAFRHIAQSEWNMLTCIHRLEWMRFAADSNEHIKANWNIYASADIECWHVNFRSLLDHVAFVVANLANKIDQVPDDSFRKLYQKAKQDDLGKLKRFTGSLGSDWLMLLQTATWFERLRCVRDAIVHKGGHTLVFEGPSKGILFQVYGGLWQNLVAAEPWMFNSNVAYFDRYAAHLTCNLIVFLEKFASIAALRLEMSPLPDHDARNCHDGFTVLKAWIDSAISAASQ